MLTRFANYYPNRRGGFWLSAAEQYWKIEMLKWFRVRLVLSLAELQRRRVS